ncbi:MAG: hypothetical protein WAM13_15735 [Candidatus Sulfotelmatobacter sp.]
MHRIVSWMLVGVALVAACVYYQNHPPELKGWTAEKLRELEAKPATPDQAPVTKIASPLEALMEKVAAPQTADPQTTETDEEPARPWKPHPSDHVGPSPVGTSTAIVHKTFAVTSTAKFPFEVPPHAASPRLRGTYHSYAKNSAAQSGDENGNVDLLLINEQQYADFLNGSPADAVYSVDSSHDQDVSLGLPSTLDHPVRYYLVFRNSSSKAGKKVVQADFRVDF